MTDSTPRFTTPFGSMNTVQFAFIAASVLALLTAPFWSAMLPSHLALMQALTIACIWAIFAMGWDIQSGYTGYISFGHSVLSGAAGYTTAMLIYNVDPNMSLWITIPLSIIVTVLIGLVIALPSLRLRGPYFSLITFAAVLVFYRMLRPLSEYTGGETGISRNIYTYGSDTTILGFELFYYEVRYYIALVPMLLVALGLLYISRSNNGMVFKAIRENESAVEAAGLDATKFKIWSFAVSSVPMGIGGVLLVHRFGSVDPELFVIVDNSIEMIAMAVLGGIGSILGPIAGAFFFIVANDYLLPGFGNVLPIIDFGTTTRYAVLWTLVLLVLVFARDGLGRKLWNWLGRLGGDDR
ncbi:branched-chain amino acid ABC transporter permease [Natronorubrum daqingense]|nr:branched-chain amino acid ABC transporter permease [Natronorubrum daqingense]